MQRYKFKLIENCFEDANSYEHNGQDADFYLEENNWDDYGFHTLYTLHATKHFTGKAKNEKISSIRIMKIGQGVGDIYLLRDFFHNNTFEELPKDFSTVCLDKIFYDWMRSNSLEVRTTIASQLHLMTSTDDPYYEKVKDSECFINSLFRDSTINNYIFQRAKEWIFDKLRTYNLRNNSFKVHYVDCKEPIDLNFTCVPDEDSPLIPNGVLAFIGENGSGKSTALYRLAKLLYYYPQDRINFKDSCGWLEPNDIGVDRMIMISYSPFDNFQIPTTINLGTHYPNLDTTDNEERFIYCGIRNIDKERKILHDNKEIVSLDSMKADRQEFTSIKKQDELADDFATTVSIMKKDLDTMDRWANVGQNASSMHPVLEEHLLNISMMADHHELAEYFKGLSTGYKYFVHSLAYVLTYIVSGTLVLFDEPENHIHPPLLSFLMATYREILKQYDSVMIVSTHSPVVLQELFSDNVFKVKRDEDFLMVAKPNIETYGATFGEITEEVFGLTTDVTQYFNAFDVLYKKWKCKESESADDVLSLFSTKLGKPISSQMASYLIDKFYTDNPNKD